MKLTHATASSGMGMGTGHVLPRKVLQALLLLPCQALNDEPTPGKGWGQILLQEWQGIASPTRRLHRYQDRAGGNPEQIQLQETLGLGTLLSTTEHPCTSVLAQPESHKDTHSQLFSN